MKYRSTIQIVRRTASIAVLITALFIVGGFASYRLIFPRDAYGTCSVLLTECHNVPVQTFEFVSGYNWGDDARVLQSSAINRTTIVYDGVPQVTGVIETRTGSPIELSNGSTDRRAAPAPHIDADGRKVLKSLGATRIHVLRKDNNLVVITAVRWGKILVYVHSIVDLF